MLPKPKTILSNDLLATPPLRLKLLIVLLALRSLKKTERFRSGRRSEPQKETFWTPGHLLSRFWVPTSLLKLRAKATLTIYWDLFGRRSQKHKCSTSPTYHQTMHVLFPFRASWLPTKEATLNIKLLEFSWRWVKPCILCPMKLRTSRLGGNWEHLSCFFSADLWVLLHLFGQSALGMSTPWDFTLALNQHQTLPLGKS